MKLLTLLISCMLLAFAGTGCASTTSRKAPTANLQALKTFYVAKLPADERGINKVIADQLNLNGLSATTGVNPLPATPVDAVVTYQDKWMWDITMYMIELNVQIREAASGMIIASGRSYRPSLQRRPPAHMAQEVIDAIFSKP